MHHKGQAINIDWSIGLGLFLVTTLSGVMMMTTFDFGPGELSGLKNKADAIQDGLVEESSYTGRRVPLIIRTPAGVDNVPVDRTYIFPASADPGSGVMNIPADVNISTQTVRTIVDAVNTSYRLTFFYDDVDDVSYGNDIDITASRINNGFLSVNPGENGLTSLEINGNELLKFPANLGSTDDSITEKELHAETLGGDLKVYSGSPEMILENAGTTTWYFNNHTTLYWAADNHTEDLHGSGGSVIEQGETEGFTIASNRGITFIGNMSANITKPNATTVKTVIDTTGRLRIRPHDSDYIAGYRRALLHTDGRMTFGAAKNIRGPTYPGLTKLQQLSKSKFEEKLDLKGWGYNISFIDHNSNTTAQLPEWNGKFEATSVARNANSGDLGIGYPSGTVNDSLVGYWRLDSSVSGSGGTVEDYSGNNNDGTTQNGVTTGVNGVFNTSAYSFDGSDDYIEISDQPFDINSSITITAWVKPDKLENSVIVNKLAGQGGYRLIVRSNSLQFSYGNGDTYEHIPITRGIKPGQWSFVAVTWNKDTLRGYVNGVEYSKTLSDSWNQNNKNLAIIGPNPGGLGGDRFKGTLDGVRIYNKSLSKSKINNIYSRSAPTTHLSFDKLTGLHLEDGTHSSNVVGVLRNTLPLSWESYDNGTRPDDWYIKTKAGCTDPCVFDYYADTDFSTNGTMSFRYFLDPNNEGGSWNGHPIVRKDLENPITVNSNLKLHWKQYDRAHSFHLCLVIEDSGSNTKRLCYLVNAMNHWGDLESGDIHVNMSAASGEIYGKCYGSCYNQWNEYTRKIRADYLDMYNDSTTPERLTAIEFEHFRNGDSDSLQGTNIDDFWINEESVSIDGKYGRGLSFDGSNDRVDVHNTPDLDSQTVAFWFKPPNGSGNSWEFPYIHKATGGGQRNPYIYGARSGEDLTYEIRDESGNYHALSSSKTNWQTDQWYHFAGTYDSSTGEWHIYINGNLDSNKTLEFDPANPDTHLEIGHPDFNGSIDEVYIFNRVLPKEDIEELYNNNYEYHSFEGTYTSERSTGQLRTWRSIKVDAEIPAETGANMTFSALNEKGEVEGSRSFKLEKGEKTYILDVPSSKNYRLKFTPTSNNITKTPVINYYTLKYGRGVVRGDEIPFSRSVVVNQRPNALINRTGGFETMESEVAVWR